MNAPVTNVTKLWLPGNFGHRVSQSFHGVSQRKYSFNFVKNFARLCDHKKIIEEKSFYESDSAKVVRYPNKKKGWKGKPD